MHYHANATTNCKQRKKIQESEERYRELAEQYQVSVGTIHHWKHKDQVQDSVSTPIRIHYALSEEEQQIVCGIRQMEWHSSQEIVLLLERLIPSLNQSNCYRTLVRAGINRKPKRDKSTKEFKNYAPGYIHIDLWYLPKLDGKRQYVYVAIDRATRMVYMAVKNDKSAHSSLEFLEEVIAFFPFTIYRILTDNGKEFTLNGYRGRYGTTRRIHDFSVYCWSEGIEHRLTQIKHPWTNGMVERMNKTAKELTVKRYHYRSVEEIASHLRRIQDYWNYYKRHKVLGLKTIPEVLKEYYDSQPNIFRVPFDLLPFTML